MNVLMLLMLAASLLSGAPTAHAVRQAGQLIQAAQSAMEAGGGLFLSARKGRVAPGSEVQVINGTAVMGDLNGDGVNDEAVIVKRLRADGSYEFDLAALLNEGGALFNIADTQVGNNPHIFSETIK